MLSLSSEMDELLEHSAKLGNPAEEPFSRDTVELKGLAIRSLEIAVDWRRRAGPTNTALEAAQIRPSGRGA
jgi:hypothetical protein